MTIIISRTDTNLKTDTGDMNLEGIKVIADNNINIDSGKINFITGQISGGI